VPSCEPSGLDAPVTTSTWHCERAWLGGEDVTSDVVITERDGTIVELVAGSVAPPGAHRLAGVVIPGMANAHSHAFHRALRGRAERFRPSFWAWRDEMYDLAGRLDPDTYLALATATFAEMLCAGFSAVGEFHYLHHGPDGTTYGEPNEMTAALVEAATRTGMRLTVLDVCYLESAPGAAPVGVQRRFADGSAQGWAERLDQLGSLPDTVRVGAAIHSARAVPPEAMAVVAAWAERNRAPLHAHVSEQPAENEAVLAAYGTTPTSLLADSGALSDRFCAVHSTHVTAADRRLLGASRATACICPTTERSLGDGLVELAELLEANVAIAVGTDAHVTIDPFEELRALEGHERLRTLRRGAMSPAAQLEAATFLGHRALGRRDAGVLAVGSTCDLVAVSTDSVRLAGTGDDDLAAVVVAATASDVTAVVVGGRLVVDDGRHTELDVPAVLADAVRQAWR
jgi:formiminoglutamate deiminase